AADRIARQLGAIAHPQLVENVATVVVDRLARDHERVRDLVTRVTLSDQLHDLELAGGEWILGRRFTQTRPLEVVADQRRKRPRVKKRLAAHARATRVYKIPIRRRLQDVAGGADFQGLEEVALAVMHG